MISTGPVDLQHSERTGGVFNGDLNQLKSIFSNHDHGDMATYKEFFLIAILTIAINGYALAKNGIPNPFIGEWASNCNEPGDDQLIITTISISPYEGICKVKDVINSSKANFSAKVYCSVEGSDAPGTARLSLANGRLKYAIESKGDVYGYRGTLKKCR